MNLPPQPVNIGRALTVMLLAGLTWGASPRNALAEAWTRMSLSQARRIQTFSGAFIDGDGIARRFRRGIILARFRKANAVESVIVAPGAEMRSLKALRADPEVEYAELDVVLTRQFVPDDPDLGRQWHHALIHSSDAWAISLATQKVTLAIVDSPFQMNHPDLVQNSVQGWDLTKGLPIIEVTNGLFHSTVAAGLAAARINNGTGVSGVANCRVLPIDVGDYPTESDLHDAVVWAADHGVRVVNASWDGAFSSVINEAGAYLKKKTRGMLFMAGVNNPTVSQRFRLNYPNQPHIYAVAMTDVQDQARSAYGPHIDFAAPGWQIYSTTTSSTYGVDSGSSYSSPLMAGIAAWIMSVNPELGPEEIEEILKESSVDLGNPGWDETYGWGRIDFGRAAQRTFATLPLSRIAAERGNAVTVVAQFASGANYRLFRRNSLANGWEPVNAVMERTNDTVRLSDPGTPSSMAFYRVEMTFPQ